MRRTKKEKSPWAALDDDYKDTLASFNDEEIRRRIAQVALDEVVNQEAKKADEDLKAKVESAKFAGEAYREATKMNKLRIGFAHSILEARGKV